MLLGEGNPRIPVIEEIVGGCTGTSDEDRCEYVYKFMQCGSKAAKERNFEISEIFD